MPSKDERLLATLIYVSSFFTVFIGPLIIWLLKKDESSFVDYHGKEYFNFLISYFIYSLISGILIIILIGGILLGIIGILVFIFTILAAVKAYEGERYQIPLVIRFLR
ncbi:hypothetical protein AN964_09940 [Heyndrickxia shackletonii]|uniref:DUF4870 domain-containing protein n=1 Tax=Heyndrickxia shackletonii TaxID=157838 RepID=A0A0Q3WX31_9BACI|nr:DUF4870 domain-containing protein [Heyndrickxia shackletonii]KQL53789.1 hypothetical protein AN964_09940 [Heyndrickxia shackletonii]MBB2481606.1 DUF4870 domain-containing protein [Bacillus sp. APMAM]NEZ02269.1 DUF4870 domain-containing protein [Heyndrickxia shackletonii]RTZ55093.1 DUF4870 domain-containing protein [Bacillus sp. SAJ1]